MSADWFAAPVLTGQKVRLEALTLDHVDGWLAAAGSGAQAEEVFRWLLARPPASVAEARAQVEEALTQARRRQRVPFAQVDVSSGAFAGTTSYYFVVPPLRSLAIGFTWLGRPWWGTGINTEAKLLLLSHAFETLGAVRVMWHTDVLNVRSQAAVEHLGATREGVFRKHRPRKDGSWRDTVQYAIVDDEWPAARDRIRRMLGEAK